MSEPVAVVAETIEKPAAVVAPAEVKPVAETPKVEAKPAVEVKPSSIISDAGKVVTPAAKVEESPEAKAAAELIAKTEAENKRLIEADDKTLTAEELAKKQELVKAQDEAKAKTVPDKYEIKAPEGMTLDEAVLEKFTPIAKELGLTNDQVQKLANFQAEQIKTAQTTQQSNFDAFVERTKTEAVEFFGSKLAAELPYVAKGRDTFADAEVMDILDTTGFSNHKAFIAMFAKMGRAVSEDKLVEGKPAVPADTRSDGQIMYAKDK